MKGYSVTNAFQSVLGKVQYARTLRCAIEICKSWIPCILMLIPTIKYYLIFLIKQILRAHMPYFLRFSYLLH